MDNETTYQTPGKLKISQDVVASIAKFATLEVDGILSVSASNLGVRGLINRVSYARPIKVELDDEVVSVEISVIVKYGQKIPQVASAVQRNVKNAIQSITGLAVSRVDVIVAGAANESEEETEAQ
ncbi:MAG: Asp23/Gls24 family envelope stress response protein [Oscillospiraceae bacterium]